MMPEAAPFNPDAVEAMARGLFPDCVEVAVDYPWLAPNGLLPEEAACLPRATPRRLGEFAAGRRAARAAMAALGHEPKPVLHQTDRAPLWPRDLSGSISHTDAICLAVLARRTEITAIGFDVEENADLPEDVLQEVCSSAERAWLSVVEPEQRGRLARLIFSAKECAYKLQYPLTGKLLGFDDFEITLDPETGQFEAHFTRDVGPFEARDLLSGRFVFGSSLMMTGATLPPKLPPVD